MAQYIKGRIQKTIRMYYSFDIGKYHEFVNTANQTSDILQYPMNNTFIIKHIINIRYTLNTVQYHKSVGSIGTSAAGTSCQNAVQTSDTLPFKV